MCLSISISLGAETLARVCSKGKTKILKSMSAEETFRPKTE
jgi:hypothetical protein